MTLMSKYLGEYIQITIDPRTLPKDYVREGSFCFIGKLADEDDHYLLLSPVDIYRDDSASRTLGITVEKIVTSLREYENRHAPGVVTLRRKGSFEDIGTRATHIENTVADMLDNATRERLVPHSAVSRVDRC